MSAFLLTWLASTPAYATPLLLAALGLILCERAGVMNLAAEGIMAVAAMTGAVTVLKLGSPSLGLAAGAVAGALISIPFALAVVVFRAEQVLAGLALVALGAGATAVLGRPYVHQPFPGFDIEPFAVLGDVPLLGPLLFRQDAMVFLAILIAVLLVYLFRGTAVGRRIRAVGEDPATADVAGVDVQATQILAVLAGGLLVGLGGAYLSVVSSRVWVDGMIAGRGWIAVALVVFARWNPLRAILGAFVFGAADALLPRLLAIGADVPIYILSTLPYALTIVVLIIASVVGRGRHDQPAALGQAYIRQDRRL
ncbi:MAG: ABC transporter permease [Geminicoccaceae bacterium]